MLDTSTSPSEARAPTRAAMWTAIPPSHPPSARPPPECSPTRTPNPGAGRLRDPRPHRMARAGPSKVAELPSPASSPRLPESHQLAPHLRCLMRRSSRHRASRAQPLLRRPDDVSEHHGGEHSFGLRCRAGAGQELFDLSEHGFRVPAQGRWSMPGSSTYRAPWICAASSSPARRLTTRSPH